MNQEWLMKNVLKRRDTVPAIPKDERDYLSLAEAQKIVDDTINYLGQHGDETEYTYISGHRKRLAQSLSMIPKALDPNDSCLDVGCYGYMLLWVKQHLGYHRVVGIEWHPDNEQKIITRQLQSENFSLEIESHNFDISTGAWPIDGQFETVLFFEVLEHINHDPMGVMEQLHDKLTMHGTLVMSVPNAISYKTLREFLIGMPPWTYWFYQPDLSHEPRHCFEYTPLIFKTLIQASGLHEQAFKIMYAYTEAEHESRTIEIAQAMGFNSEELGETMIINSTKESESIVLRYPDVIYSPKGYYEHISPVLQPRLEEVHTHFSTFIQSHNTKETDNRDDILFTCELQLQQLEKINLDNNELSQQAKTLQADKDHLARRVAELEGDLNQMLFNCDCYLQNEQEQLARVNIAEEGLASALIEVKNHKTWAESLQTENTDLSNRVNELLFACDCYLQQANDATHCVQVIREQRFRRALNTSKAFARKTPILRSALRPVYRNTKKFIKRRM